MGFHPESFAVRALYISVLVNIVAALAIFAFQNNESVTLSP
jgi:hypothetical protein